MNRITTASFLLSARFYLVPIILTVGLLIGASTVPSPTTGLDENSAHGEIAAAENESKAAATEEEDALLFEGWEAPPVALFISGRQNGYIEPCGCTGLDNQKGGLMRRHTFYQQLLEAGWSVVGIDAGNQVRRYGRQANLKIAATYEAMGTDMQYEAIGFGPDDLQLPTIELMQVMTNSGLPNNAFVCANVTVFEPGYTSRYRVIERRGKKIGVTMILGDEHLGGLPPSDDVTTRGVDASLGEVVPQMQRENCDVNVLVAYASLEQSRDLAIKFPFFDVLVTGGVDGEPTKEPELIPANGSSHVTQMIQTGTKGMHVGIIGIFDDGLRYQRVPMDARFEDSDEVRDRFLSYQTQMEALGLEGLEVRPVTHPSGRTYVGSEACADCHDSAFDIWKDGIDGEGGPHYRATLDLTDPGERTWVKRHHDPECISCHVTGWNPQQFFPYESGYLELDHELMHGNGCENCHGPGSHHVAAENGDIDVDEDTRLAYVEEMVVTLQESRDGMCASCHDIDNSPDFHVEGAFEEYWEAIRHYED